jgi:hypothetical protein
MKPKPLQDVTTLREFFAYDKTTGVVVLLKRTSQRTPAGFVVGSVSANGYLKVSFRGKSYPLSRVIWKLVTGLEPKGDIDHINRDRGDNRWENLRDVTPQQNQLNRLSRGYRRLKNERYRVTLQGKDVGYFNTPDEASFAYQKEKDRVLNESLRL